MQDKVLIKDINELREFIKLERKKEDYFKHSMQKVLAKRARTRHTA